MRRSGLRMKALALGCCVAGAAGTSILEGAMQMLKSLPEFPEAPLFSVPVLVQFKPGCLTPTDNTCAKSVIDSLTASNDCGDAQMYPNLGMASITCTSSTSTTVLRTFRANPNIQTASVDNKWTLPLPSLETLLDPNSATQATDTPAVSGDGSVRSAADSTDLALGTAYNWGRDRVNKRNNNLDQNMNTCPNGGAGVVIYLLDTGCSPNHQELQGRATTESFKGDDGSPYLPSGEDTYGHGSHTACLAGGSTVGIAWAATIRCIKVLGDDGTGSSTWSVAAMEQVLQEAQQQNLRKVVVNMSLGGVPNAALTAAVKTLTDAGIIVVAAAGNSAEDAKGTSPANAPSAITVAATTRADAMASYSNTGWGIDVMAPGSGITSCYKDGPSRYAAMSGTSMASPIVAGMVACIMANSNSKLCKTSDDYVRKLYGLGPTWISQWSPTLGWRGPFKPLVFMDPNKPATCDSLYWWSRQ